MAYTSFGFLLFLLAVTVIYYLIPKRFQWCLLLAASYAFYLFSGIPQIAFIIGTTLITYFSALLMQKKRDEYKNQLAQLGKEATKEEKRALKKAANAKIHRIQVITVIVHLLVLAFVKYLKFATVNINSLFTLFKFDFQLPFINVIVPLGISFYTFTSIGYLIDVGRGKYDAEKHLGKFALFVSFFPSIVQGPISRFDDVGKQLAQPHSFNYDNLVYGAELMLWGFFKKLVIADRAYSIVSTVFSADYKSFSGSAIFFGMVCYAIQIYGDFSGGIDISRGAAQILGIDLPLNFERPYFSTSLAEYWRRWHITLGNFMRDYVFYAIMLSKPITKLSKQARQKISAYAGKMVPSVITPFFVFCLIGIWHGASWQYVAFGLYNATIVASGVALTPVFNKMIEKLHINSESFSFKLFRIARTFLITGVSKLLVKSPGLRAGLHCIKTMFTDFDPDFLFGLDGKIFDMGLDGKNLFVLFLSVLVLITVSVLQENGMEIRKTLSRQNIAFRWGLLLVLLAVVLVFGIYGPTYNAADFIYKAY